MTAESAPSGTTTLLSAALAYGKGGYPVIPLHAPKADKSCDCGASDCTSVGKHPRTPHGLKDAATDELTIRRWWAAWPQANIGLVIPHGYVAVDVDGTEGAQSLADAGHILPETARATTGRGSHHLYRSTRVIGPKVGLLPHVDLRGPGSYIVAAPSLHASGVRYAWDVAPSALTLADAPEWLVAPAKDAESALRERFDTASALEGVAVGQRDVALFKLASKLRYADVPYDTALAFVLQSAARCTPPFPERQAEDKVRSAYGRYPPTILDAPDGYRVEIVDQSTVRVTASTASGPVELTYGELEKSAHALDAELTVRALLPGMPPDAYSQRLNVLAISARQDCRRELETIYGKSIAWTTVLARSCSLARDAYLGAERLQDVRKIAAPERLEFIVDGLLPADGITVLFGAGSGGKTFIALHLAIHVALGMPWLGRPVKRRRVLVNDYETGSGTFGYRLDRLCAGLGVSREDLDGIGYWWADGIPLHDQIAGLRSSIQRNDIGLMILDHAALACGGEPEKADSALRFYRAAGKLGIPILVLAHVTGNGETDPSLTQRPFGSVFWSNSARRTWFIQRAQEDDSDLVSLGLQCRKVNDGRKPGDIGINLFFEGDAGPVQIVSADISETPQLQKSRSSERKVWDVLTEPMSYVGIAQALQESGIEMGPETIRKTISAHPRLFERLDDRDTHGRGQVTQWARRGWNGNAGSRNPLREKESSGFIDEDNGSSPHPISGDDEGTNGPLRVGQTPEFVPALRADSSGLLSSENEWKAGKTDQSRNTNHPALFSSSEEPF